MATVTLLTSDAVNPADLVQETAPITPAPNSVLYVALAARDSGGFPNMPVVVSGGGLAWTLVETLNPDDGGTSTQQSLWTADAGASPGTFPVTLTYTGGSARGLLWQVVEVDGVTGEVQRKVGDSGQSNVNHFSVDFDAAPDPSSVVIVFTTIQQSVAENLVPSAGFTELSSLGPVDNQYSFVQFILSGSTQGIDHRVDGSAGLMGGIQVEQAVGGAVTNMNVWDGAAWVLAVPSVWDGSVWVPVVGKVWDGSQWT